jgi:hypothetical protein
MLTKPTVEAVLKSEMNYHLGYDKSQLIERDGAIAATVIRLKLWKESMAKLNLKRHAIETQHLNPS